MSLRRAALATVVLGLAACQVEKTQEGELPDVTVEREEGKLPDIDVEGGQLPKYEVKGTGEELRLRMDTVKVPVPKLERVPDTIRD